MTYQGARSAYGKAWLAVGVARHELSNRQTEARGASSNLKAVCPHDEGFEW